MGSAPSAYHRLRAPTSAVRFARRAAGADDAYASAYRQFLAVGLSDEEWQPVESFFRELAGLGAQRGFKTLIVILPVNDVVTGPSPTTHPPPITALGSTSHPFSR